MQNKRISAIINLLEKYRDWLVLANGYSYIDKLCVVSEICKGYVSFIHRFKPNNILFENLEKDTEFFVNRLNENDIDSVINDLLTKLDRCVSDLKAAASPERCGGSIN